MTARRVPEERVPALRDRLAAQEPLGVYASSLLRLQPVQRLFWEQGEELLAIRNTQFLIPLGLLRPRDFPQPFFAELNQGGKAITGPPAWLRPWEEVFGPAHRWMDYLFLYRPPHRPIEVPPLPTGVAILEGGPSDFSCLWPLRKAYILEEVVFSPEDFREASQRLAFRRALLQERHWYLSLYGRPVCNVSTNAQGLRWIQLGGMYTEHRWRRRGLAFTLLAHVVRQLHEEGWGVCLFVKTTNLAAQSLYRKLGFEVLSDYRIVYYLA